MTFGNISKKATVGKNTKIWNGAHIREGAVIGNNCIIGERVYIDSDVQIGSNCKIQNNSSIYRGTIIEDGVFIGPHVICTNDKVPRAVTSQGILKTIHDWTVGEITIKKGASLGAGTIVLPNVTIGSYAMVGAGSIVTKNVPAFALVYGNPAKVVGKVDKEGNITEKILK